MPTIYIDNQPHVVPEGVSLLEACLSAGFNVPYFCWHPAMHSVGACRQCAVKVFRDEQDARGRIVMSCMTPVKDGMRLSIDDPEAVAFRKAVSEWLMVNHPHDCPICDEGGECHLQDMTAMTGHAYRRYRFTKRTHRDQDLGPFVHMEMNRCIQCYRCVRFYRDHAGGRDFGVLGWHDHVYFGRHGDGRLASEFSGNLVEVCPTGVFTDKTQKRHTTRKWDLQVAPGVCVHCGLGCNTIPGERYGTLRRIRARFNAQVNGYFLCDRGRYGYEFTTNPKRIRQPLARDEDGVLKPVSKSEAIAIARRMLASGMPVGVGSGRASLESNFALSSLAGVAYFVHCATPETARLAIACVWQILRWIPCRTPSLREVESADAVLVLGEDVTNSAPMLDLAIRQAVRSRPRKIGKELRIPDWDDASIRLALQEDRGPLYVATPRRTKLDELAAGTFRAAPDDLARLAFAVAHEIDPAAPPVPDLAGPAKALAARIAGDLLAAEKPLVICGPSVWESALVQAAANVASALARKERPALLSLTSSECNSVGLARLTGTAEPAVDILRRGDADALVIAEGDLFRHMGRSADGFLAAAKHVIVIDHTLTPTAERADLVLPAAALGEADGTFVNNEGRAQRFFKAFVPEGDIQESWKWLAEITDPPGAAIEDGRTTAPTLDELHAAMAKELPDLAPVRELAPPAGFRQVGQRIPRQPHRYSGRTAVNANRNVHEPQPPQDADSPLSFSMEGSPNPPPAALLANYWSPGWNSLQAINKFQVEVGGPLHGGDPGRRLIEPTGVARASCPCVAGPSRPRSSATETVAGRMGETPMPPPYFADVPPAFAPREGAWWAVPACHIFGSEELSALAPAVASLAPRPYVAIAPREAARAGLEAGRKARLTVGGQSWTVEVLLDDSLPAGVAAVPAGLAELAGLSLPDWVEIRGEG